MKSNQSKNLLIKMIEDNIDAKTLQIKEPTGKLLVINLKGLEKLGVITRGKGKAEITQEVHLFLDAQALDVGMKKNLMEIFTVYVNNYALLFKESEQKKSTQRIHDITSEWGGNGYQKNTLTPEQQEKINLFKSKYTQRVDDLERLFKESSDVNREQVKEFASNPNKIHFGIDECGECYIELVELVGKKIKGMNLQSLPSYMKKQGEDIFPSDIKNRWKTMKLFSLTQSSGIQECVDLKYLSSKEFDDCLKKNEADGYFRNADKEDDIMHYLAKEFGMTYNNTPKCECQSIMRIKMALLHRWGRDFVRRDKNGNNLGDLYKKDIDNIQVARMHETYQDLDLNYPINCLASVMLVAG